MSLEREQPHLKPLAKIAELRRQHGSTMDIVEQMFGDAYQSGLDNPELSYIGFRALMERGHEGQAALQWIARDTGSLGGIAKKILETPQCSIEQLERLTGIQRYTEMVQCDFSKSDEAMALFKRTYKFGCKHDLVHTSFEEMMEQVQHDATQNKLGRLDYNQTTLSIGQHFRMCAPAFYDLLGVDGITDLRTLPRPKTLLLGASHPISVQGFDRFMKSIHPAIDHHVIDLDSSLSNRTKLYDSEIRTTVDAGDALAMPYADNSIDQVYTNALLHQLRDYRSTTVATTDLVKKLLAETKRVLKPGGRLMMLERSYGVYKGSSQINDNFTAACQELRSLALQGGFSIQMDQPAYSHFSFTQQERSARVSPNGLVYYPGALLTRMKGAFISLGLEKTSSK